jgi:hypothetical protein
MQSPRVGEGPPSSPNSRRPQAYIAGRERRPKGRFDKQDGGGRGGLNRLAGQCHLKEDTGELIRLRKPPQPSLADDIHDKADERAPFERDGENAAPAQLDSAGYSCRSGRDNPAVAGRKMHAVIGNELCPTVDQKRGELRLAGAGGAAHKHSLRTGKNCRPMHSLAHR